MEVQPTMNTIYLAGPPSAYPLTEVDAFKWHDEAAEAGEEYDVRTINPFEEKSEMFDVHPEELTTKQLVDGAFHSILESDAVLVRVADGFNQPGGAVEMRFAYEAQIPVVGWLDHDHEPRSFYKYHMTSYVRDLETAVQQASILAE